VCGVEKSAVYACDTAALGAGLVGSGTRVS
jgi:hypothetical protein